ncbi:MAG: nucleotidyltransferase family protein, partial [Thermoanaerobaculia bacterium]
LYAVAGVRDLRPAAIAAAAGEPLRLTDLQSTLEVLAAAGIPALVLKGSALAYDLYASPDQRPRGDTDLLVPRSSFDSARAVLRAEGFDERRTSGDEHGIRQVSFSRTDRLGAKHVYDLHWEAVNSPVIGDAFRQDRLVRRPLPAIGPAAATLPWPEALLLACVHRVLHHYDDGRLIWLADIAFLRRAMSAEEHARFWRLAAEHRLVAICRRSVALADSWMGESGSPAEDFLTRAELARIEPSARFLDPDVTYGGVMLTNLQALPWRMRITRLRQLALPPTEFIRESFPGWSRSALPWLYAYRAARGIVRLFRRERGG